jgi:DNA polymerase III epsilon subunit-like protein
MKLVDYLEMAITRDVTELLDLEGFSVIIFDLETNGLIGERGLQLIKSQKYNPETKKTDTKYIEDDYSEEDRVFRPHQTELHIAEIGAVAYDPITKRSDRLHLYIDADLNRLTSDGKPIKDLISWDDIKQSSAIKIKNALSQFDSFLKKYPKKIIIAHNGNRFDFKIMGLLGDKFGMIDLENTFSLYHPNLDTILVDTVNNKLLKQVLDHLTWPVSDKGRASNKQADLIKMFGIDSGAGKAHTAIGDVKSLAKYLIKILKEMKKTVRYIKPSLNIEKNELERTADFFGYDIDRLIENFEDGELVKLEEKDWKKLENTDSNKVNNIEDIKQLATKYGKDFDQIYKQITLDKKIEAPIVLYRKRKPPYLVGGNTRLMILKTLGIQPMIWAVEAPV